MRKPTSKSPGKSSTAAPAGKAAPRRKPAAAPRATRAAIAAPILAAVPDTTALMAQGAQSLVQEGQAAATKAWMELSTGWFKVWAAALDNSVRMQAEMWQQLTGQTAGALPMVHQMFTAWALPDPLTDRSLWWSVENLPAST